MSSTQGKVSLACQFPDKFVKVKGSKIHYVDIGEGDPILFLHGIPTFSYVWRNVLPTLAQSARCIAPDLIGMGFSDKPNIEYRVFDHIEYMQSFIEALNLQSLTLVVHGWGSVIGVAIAAQNPQKVKAMALYESYIRLVTSRDQLSLPMQHVVAFLQRPGVGYRAVVQQNFLVNKLLPASVISQLDREVMDMYRQPFPTAHSRRPLWQYIQDLPLNKGAEDIINLIRSNCAWLQQTFIPKLLLYAIPGFITTVQTVQWAKDHLPNLKLDVLESVLHLAQESEPQLFAVKLHAWYIENVLCHQTKLIEEVT